MISNIERARTIVQCNCNDPEQRMEFLVSQLLHTCQPWPSKSTRHIHVLDLRPSCIARVATEPFARKHATKGARWCKYLTIANLLQCRYFVENCAKKDIPTQEHVVGRKIILNEPGAYRGRASKIIQERCICSYLDASPAQMLLSSILGNLLLRFGVENILHLLNIATATIPRNRSEICSRPWVSKVLVRSRQVLSVETICAQAN